jgi:hypothetical protein
MLATNIEQEVKEILEKKGKGGWLRVSECAKIYGKDDESRETKFYRWRKKVEKGKTANFQVLKLPGNISFIGLSSADPKVLESLISEDKKLAKSVKSGLGFFEWLNKRAERKRLEEEQHGKEALTIDRAYRKWLAETFPSLSPLSELDEAEKKERKKLDH